MKPPVTLGLLCIALALILAGCDFDQFTVEVWNDTTKEVRVEDCAESPDCKKPSSCVMAAHQRCPLRLRDGSRLYVRVYLAAEKHGKPMGCLVIQGDQGRYDRAQWSTDQLQSCARRKPVPPNDIDGGSGGD
jgi:hypothetical protein